VWGNPGSPRPCPREGLALKQGMGKPGFPILPPAGGFGRAQPVRREMGNLGFPIPSPGGRVGKGFALPKTTVCSLPHTDGMNILLGRAAPSHTLPGVGDGETGFPHPPAQGLRPHLPGGGGVGKPGFPTPLAEGVCSREKSRLKGKEPSGFALRSSPPEGPSPRKP